MTPTDPPKKLRILVACEFSGRVREAFRKLGHDAWSCDILPADDSSPYHIQDDVLKHLNEGWDMMIAHPPCTYFSQAGMHYLETQPGRWEKHAEMLELWNTLWNAPIDYIAMENPVGWLSTNWGKPDQIIDPFNFGTPERKRTCLWLKGLPRLKDTNNVKDQVKPTGYVIRKSGQKKGQRYNYYWRQSKTGHQRSLTFQCIADAMAEQWGRL